MASFNPAGYMQQPNLAMPSLFNIHNQRRVITTPAQLVPAQAGVHQSISPTNYMPASVMALANNPRIPISIPPTMRMVPSNDTELDALLIIISRQIPGGFIMRLLLFGEYLGGDRNVLGIYHQKTDIHYWKVFAQFFFADDVYMKYTLCKERTDNPQEGRTFELKYAVIPRFYHTFFESGVTSIQLILGSPKEQDMGNGCQLDCPKASMVVHSGHLIVMFNQQTKISSFEFRTKNFTEYIPRSHVARHMPNGVESSVVCEYGIPHRTFRCLDLAECSDIMQGVMTECVQKRIGPMQAFRDLTMAMSQSSQLPMQTTNQAILPYIIKDENSIKMEQHDELIGGTSQYWIASSKNKYSISNFSRNNQSSLDVEIAVSLQEENKQRRNFHTRDISISKRIRDESSKGKIILKSKSALALTINHRFTISPFSSSSSSSSSLSERQLIIILAY
ncbi:11706_t:CDS:2 [Ambispora leptoticha]|uniref:11706_t:CDS:1 n=1 Tax=Ambispora leptoticha TaxID=144679 RepID=A0A9N8W5M6_9GLOM|nr:11706_t:CDS:2 [Ambispora leptoticha]